MSKHNNYFLNIFHRNISVDEDNQNHLQSNKSPGHFYLMLDSSEKQSFFGKFPKKGDWFNLNQLVGGSQINTFEQEDEHEKLSEYLKLNPSKGLLSRKIVGLKEHEYTSAFNFAVSKCEGQAKEGIYIIGFLDCTDFVQSVYHAAGLPLYFTILYTRDELQDLRSLAAKKVLLVYGSRDTFKHQFSNQEALSKEVLGEQLNISVDTITLNLILSDSSLPSFRVNTQNVLKVWQSRFGYELSDLENKEDKQFEIFGAQKTINNKVSELLSNPEKLQKYQEEQLNQAIEELKITDSFIPNFSQASINFANEHKDLFQQFTQINNKTEIVEKLEKANNDLEEQLPKIQNFIESFGNNQNFTSNNSEQVFEDQNAWANEIVFGTVNMMNNLQNNPEMQEFMQMFSGNNSNMFNDQI